MHLNLTNSLQTELKEQFQLLKKAFNFLSKDPAETTASTAPSVATASEYYLQHLEDHLRTLCIYLAFRPLVQQTF